MLDSNDEGLNQLAVYDIDYYGWGLNIIEQFCEGEFVLAKRIKIERYYKIAPTHPDRTMNIFLTKVVDITLPRE
jgi:hypothetical protein